jgi:hypothetical protein
LFSVVKWGVRAAASAIVIGGGGVAQPAATTSTVSAASDVIRWFMRASFKGELGCDAVSAAQVTKR